MENYPQTTPNPPYPPPSLALPTKPAVVALLEGRGVRLAIVDGQLVLECPKAVHAWARALLSRHKDAVRGALMAEHEDRECLLHERAGILMDSGMDQEAADAAAAKLLEVDALLDAPGNDPLRRACRLVEAHFVEATMTIRKG